MSTSDTSALKNSGLNAFLFAEVGTELNGSPLTILSILARLGLDPWAEAAKWTKLPKATTIDRLAKSIVQMPLPPDALNEARTTASRLVLLLPAPVARQSAVPVATKTAKSRWVVAAICGAAMALGLAFTVMSKPGLGNRIMPISDLSTDAGPNAPTK